MGKKLKGLLLALVLCLQVVVPATKADAATVLYNNATGYEGNYAYELWKDYGDTSMTLKGNGLFECWWQNIGNVLFRKGVKWDCTKTYSQLGNITVSYGVDYQPNGNSYLCVYGWCRNPLVEYYIVDCWGTWRPPGATSKGTITVDGATYDVYETTRVNQPSIDGNTTFQQYWSVRQSKRTSGTISVTEHFKAWERMGMKMGLMYEAAFNVEGYQSSGWADVYQLDITVGGSYNGGGSSSGGSSSSGDSASSAPGTNKGTEIECESMTKSGQYTGTISNPFNGVALYGNDDAVSTTVNFSSGTHDFSLRGASNGDELAQADLYVGGEKKGTFYFGDANTAEYTIKDVSTGTGNKKVEIKMSADDGNWDLYADALIIGGDGVSTGSGNQGGNSGNQGGNSGNQGGNSGNQGGNSGNQGGNSGNQGGNTSGGTTNTGATMECEEMTKSGQYTGTVSSPFNGVALYANDDAVSYTQNFTNGTNTFTLTGASNGDNMARVDLFIDGQNKGTFYYGDANVADYVIEDVATGTGNKKVELKVTADDGTWDAYIDKLTINGGAASGGTTSGDSGNTGNNSGNTGNNSGNTGNNSGNTGSSATTVQCEEMTKSGQYTGTVSSPFNGVALYANNDAVSYTQNFAYGSHDFTLRGASNGDNMAMVDLVIGNETKGTFYFGDANIAEYTISNVSHGTGDQTVKLVVTADDGKWDAYIDSLTISAAGSVSNDNGSNAGGNNSGNQGGNTSSAVTIETTTPSSLLTTNRNVQYGQMKRTQYWSNTCEKYRNVIVLLPPNYDSSKQYPVMYALHGLNQDETFLIGDGNSGFRIMLGNMIQQGLAKDMIVVFPYIFASKTMDTCTGFDQQSFAAYDNFINELTNDLMPYIKRTYSVAEGRENTAIIGFSMGGRESLYIGYKLQNQIGYVGAIAPAPGLTPGNDFSGSHQGMISESEFKFAQDPKVLMICCGTADSVVGTFPKSYHEILTRNGESHYWWEIQGSDHGDPAITNGLYNFCKAIFK